MPSSMTLALPAREPLAIPRSLSHSHRTHHSPRNLPPRPLSASPPRRGAGALFHTIKRGMRTPPTPLFRFGLLADVQYALKDTQIKSAGSRRMAWSESLGKVADAVSAWNAHTDVAFVLSLGDIIEGNEAYMEKLTERELRAVLAVLKHSRAPVKHILGNHCRRLSKPKLLDLLSLEQTGSYYHFAPASGWRVVCLDTTEMCPSAVDADPNEKAAVARMVSRLSRPTHHFHGAASDTQLSWLGRVLSAARENGERVIIMTHYPLRGARATHLALNSSEILDVIERSRAHVVAVFAGHDHNGATMLPDGRNDLRTAFITLPAVVESPQDSNAFATVAVYSDGSLEVTGHGTVPSYRVRPTGGDR